MTTLTTTHEPALETAPRNGGGLPQFGATPERKALREAYGFDDVAIVPGQVTINPELTDVTTEIAGQHLQVPILAAAMDAVVDPEFAVKVGARGGLAVLNLEGLQCRFDDPEAVLEEVAASDTEGATAILQRAYTTPIRDELVGCRVAEIKAGGAAAAVSVTPPNAKRLAPAVRDAGADVFVVQSTVTTARHYSNSKTGLILRDLIDQIGIPTLVGNTVGFQSSIELMEEGIAGLLSASAPAPPAPAARCSASASPRSPPPSSAPTPATSTPSAPAATSRSSPTAASAPAATSARPSWPAPTPS